MKLGRPRGMKLRRIALACLTALVPATVSATRLPAQHESSAPAVEAASRPDSDPRVPFNVGEVLSYSITYAVLDAGTLRLAVEGIETLGGRRAYHLTSRAQTNSTVSAIYSLTDNLQSWLDVERLHSLRFVREAVERGKKRDKRLTFDQARHVKVFEDSGDEKAIVPDAQDDVSIFYYLRTLPLEEGRSFTLNNLADPDDNPMRLAVLGKESVKVPAGKFDCWVVQLKVNTDSGIFSQGGEMKVWMTRDARHVPVKLESKLAVGSFTATLTSQHEGAPGALASEAPPAGR